MSVFRPPEVQSGALKFPPVLPQEAEPSCKVKSALCTRGNNELPCKQSPRTSAGGAAEMTPRRALSEVRAKQPFQGISAGAA